MDTCSATVFKLPLLAAAVAVTAAAAAAAVAYDAEIAVFTADVGVSGARRAA